MTSITKLPCEIMTSVMRDLGNIRFLLPCLLTCRYFYSCFKENLSVAADILEQQVTPAFLPYSIAVLEASHLNPRAGISVRKLFETLYKEPSKLRSRLRTISVPLLVKMGKLHEAVQSLATQFSNEAWARISYDQGSQTSGSLSLSPTEYYRFCQAFYRFELYSNLSRSSMPSDIASFSDDDIAWFIAQHAPWENEQLGSVHEFLELKLSKVSYDVLAHDVEFGELGIDYLTAGRNDGWRQLWVGHNPHAFFSVVTDPYLYTLLLSQGIGFIYRMINYTSYDAKKALLKSSFGAINADLYEALTAVSDDDLDGNIPLAEYSNETLEALFLNFDGRDADKGPFEAWWIAFHSLPRSMWAMLDNNSGLRERAYVFWDLDRIKRYDLLDLFVNTPEESELLSTKIGWHHMRESLKERSMIWLEAGSGY